MSCTLVFCSGRTGNTRKVVQAIEQRFGDIRVIDARATPADQIDLAATDLVVLASGMYFGFPGRSVSRLVRTLPRGQKVYLLTTHGSASDHYQQKWSRAVEKAGLVLMGSCGAQGFYDFGPFGLKGGMHKGHPTDEEIAACVEDFAHVYAEFAE